MLQFYPVEILSNIILHLSVEDIAPLILLHPLLTYKIKNGGWTDVTTTYELTGKLGQSFAHFLRALPHFQIKKIIDRDGVFDFDNFPTSLTRLDSRNNFLRNTDMIQLPKNLTHLNLSHSCWLTGGSFKLLPRNLLYLNLRSSVDIKNSDILSLPKGLTHLNIANAKQITDACIQFLPRNLIYLDISYNKQIGNLRISKLPPNLEYLDMFYNEKLTDEGIKSLPRSLTFFDISLNTRLTNDCIPHLPPNLKTLGIAYEECKGITADCAPLLPKSLERLGHHRGLIEAWRKYRTGK